MTVLQVPVRLGMGLGVVSCTESLLDWDLYVWANGENREALLHS